MVRMLQAVGVVALICAGVVFALCVAQRPRGTLDIERNLGPSVVERFKQAGGGKKSSEETLSPLVQQAEAFASYLNPPKPAPQVQETPTAKSSLKQSVSLVELPQTTPKFALLATSYYRARPGESLALVSEPGSEPRWVAQGAPLGHFVVEKIERGMIVYRDGGRLGEMAVGTQAPLQTEQAVQTTLASGETGTSPSKPSSPGELETRPRQPMHKLGPPRQEIHVVAYDHTTASG